MAKAIADRFWSKVDRRGPDDCWPWTGARDGHGYGQLRGIPPQGSVGAHRVSYELAHGPIPPGREILHSCDHPWCVNPAHLSAGTHRDNLRDMQAKGRRRDDSALPRGVDHQGAKLTDHEVIGLREDRASGMSYRRLATKYGISKSTAFDIVQRSKWRHVDGV